MMATLAQNVAKAITSINEFRGLIEKTATSITIPEGTTKIGYWIFSQYDALTNISIPSSVTYIDSGAFAYCGNLTNFDLPSGITKIKASTFLQCFGLTSMTIPNSVTEIEQLAFQNCSNLTSVTLPSNLTKIGKQAFQSCRKLENILIPHGVTTIATNAFAFCTELATINFPNTLVEIIDSVGFDTSTKLENVTLENGFNCNNLSLSPSTLYSHDTILSWFNALADRTGETAYTLYIGTTNKNKMTAEEIAIATNKNWNLA